MNILVAGATGFVGSHLVPALLADGHRVRCLSRDPARSVGLLPSSAEVARGDVHDLHSLETAMDGTDVAYYLVHSMEGSEFEFEARDRSAARNFAAAADWSARETIRIGSTYCCIGMQGSVGVKQWVIPANSDPPASLAPSVTVTKPVA